MQGQPLWPTVAVMVDSDSDGITWVGCGNTLLAKDSKLPTPSNPSSVYDLIGAAASCTQFEVIGHG